MLRGTRRAGATLSPLAPADCQNDRMTVAPLPATLSISHWGIRQRWMELNMVFWERGQDRGFIPNLRPWYTGPGG
jgi:hypothetical protein